MDSRTEIDMARHHRRVDAHGWMDMGHLASRHQETMDQFDGTGEQRLLLPADGIVLLHHRL